MKRSNDMYFELREIGMGVFRLSGELSFAASSEALKKASGLFNRDTLVTFDLADVSRADSAGIALLLEWQRRAQMSGGRLRYKNLSDQLLAIARVTGVDAILEQFVDVNVVSLTE